MQECEVEGGNAQCGLSDPQSQELLIVDDDAPMGHSGKNLAGGKDIIDFDLTKINLKND